MQNSEFYCLLATQVRVLCTSTTLSVFWNLPLPQSPSPDHAVSHDDGEFLSKISAVHCSGNFLFARMEDDEKTNKKVSIFFFVFFFLPLSFSQFVLLSTCRTLHLRVADPRHPHRFNTWTASCLVSATIYLPTNDRPFHKAWFQLCKAARRGRIIKYHPLMENLYRHLSSLPRPLCILTHHHHLPLHLLPKTSIWSKHRLEKKKEDYRPTSEDTSPHFSPFLPPFCYPSFDQCTPLTALIRQLLATGEKTPIIFEPNHIAYHLRWHI